MNKLEGGRGTTEILVLGEWLNITYHYEPELKPLEDDPGCDEYLEIISAKWHGSGKEIDIAKMSDSEYNALIAELAKQSKGGTTASYKDSDLYRAPVNERIRQELGFGLLSKYERDDV